MGKIARIAAQQRLKVMARKQMIAIVDDDESVRLAMESLIRSLGYDARIFASAEELLDSPVLSKTQCVICDINMPGMGGEALQHKLKAGYADLPIIFITAFAEEGCRKRTLAAGAICCLSKPLDDEKLVECIDTALEGIDVGQ
jgi:FixJ family two-component response regulator